MVPDGLFVPLVDPPEASSSSSDTDSDELSDDDLPKKRHYVGLPPELQRRRSAYNVHRRSMAAGTLHPDQIVQEEQTELIRPTGWKRFFPKLFKAQNNASMAIKYSKMRDMNLHVAGGKKPKGILLFVTFFQQVVLLWSVTAVSLDFGCSLSRRVRRVLASTFSDIMNRTGILLRHGNI